MTLNNPKPSFQYHAILWRWISHKRLKIRPQLLWKANKKPHPIFRMVPVWITFSDLFKVTIIQRQITWKWYNIQLYYNGRLIESRIWCIERRHFQWLWTTPTPSFKVTPFFDAEYLINGTTYRHSFNEILIGTYTRPTQQYHFEWPCVTLSDLAKYSTTRIVARSFCDSWASCSRLVTFLIQSPADFHDTRQLIDADKVMNS